MTLNETILDCKTTEKICPYISVLLNQNPESGVSVLNPAHYLQCIHMVITIHSLFVFSENTKFLMIL